ncbi:MAG TPA: hypothetical protein VGQ73_02895 [Gemmatimonadales bacterium]|nr:hypothetical protein [Gemmatimonadales bacterium]
MITADARSRITQQDVELLGSCLGTNPARLASMDAVLDRREVAGFLLSATLPGPSPSLLFYVLVRHSLLDVGVEDPTVADYFAAVLREFGIRNRATRVAEVDDQEHHYLVDILADLAAATGERQFKVSVHLGNYALWLSGVFPERIAAQRLRRGGPDVSYYESMGGRGYAEASEHRLAERIGLDDVLRTAAERVHEVRVALNQVSAQLALRGSRLAA